MKEGTGDAFGELRRKSIPDLEAELHRLTSSSRMPPSASRQLFESYALHTELSDAEQRENAKRTFLVNSIVAYRRPEMQLTPTERTSVKDLMSIALTMPIKAESYAGTTVVQRHEHLVNLVNEYDQERYAPEDRDFYRRLALAFFIRENAADPRILESEEPGKRIDALTGDELCCPRCGAVDVDNSQRVTPQSGNSGDVVTFVCRTCGHSEAMMDGDLLALHCPWVRPRP